MANKRVRAWERSKRQGGLSRQQNIRDERPRILVVCEGKKTEPNYFRGFRIPSLNLEVVPAGAMHVRVVKTAVEILEHDDEFEQVWCVFDRDKQGRNPRDLEQFNQAMLLASQNGINVAYSNDAFELWYLLHYGYYDTSLARADYITKLNGLIPGGYLKNDPGMYQKLEGKMEDAIRNARRLYEFGDRGDPGNQDPSTTVFKLVEELRKYI